MEGVSQLQGRARDLGVSARVLGDRKAPGRSGRSGRVRRAAGRRCLGVGRARQPRRQHRQRVPGSATGGGAARDVAGFRSAEPRSGCDVPGWLPPAWWCRGISVAHLCSGAAVQGGRGAGLGGFRCRAWAWALPLLGITGNDLHLGTIGSLVRHALPRHAEVRRPSCDAAALERRRRPGDDQRVRRAMHARRCLRAAGSPTQRRALRGEMRTVTRSSIR